MEPITTQPKVRTPDWPALLKAFEATGQSAASFCREHGIKYGHFLYRRRRLKAHRSKPRRAFVAVRAESSSSFKITLPHGLLIECHKLPEPHWLKTVLQELKNVAA